MTARTDKHRPSAIQPSAYRHLHTFADIPSEALTGFESAHALEDLFGVGRARELYSAGGVAIHGNEWQCDACGSSYRSGSLYTHIESGEVISLGHDCADSMELGYPIAQAKAIQSYRTRMLKARRNRLARHRGLKAWARSQDAATLDALRCDHQIVRSMRGQLIRYGDAPRLSPRQISLCLKLRGEQLQRAEREAAEAEIEYMDAPLVSGRQEVSGVVLATKWQESDYGGSQKILVAVEGPEGRWLVWGTAPRALLDAADGEPLKGREVAFEAKLSVGSEPHFAFAARPTKAVLSPPK